ncbi:MAG: helix-turn-helix domain-containing protein [Epulopiscium sp.]|nr:helix-turn-helix domain-containing protein [Candidatus Epulonipiscium sp.]
MDTKRFGETLSKIRQNKNMTQEELASRLGVTPQAVSKWERGLNLPDISLVKGICTILSVDSNDLLGIAEKNQVVENDDVVAQREILMNACAEPLLIIFGKNLIPIFVEGLKTNIINEKRKKLAIDTGILVPVIRIKDDINLKENGYCIMSCGKILIQNELKEVNRGTYEFLINQLFELCVVNYSTILNKQIIKMLVDNVKKLYPGVADDIIPEKISYLTYQKVLAGVLENSGYIRNHIRIIELLENEIILKGNKDIDLVIKSILTEMK